MAQIRLSISAVFGAMLAGILVLPGAGRAQYQISSSVFGNGGALVSGGNYSMDGTAGQTEVGTTSSASDVNDIGFWYLDNNAVTGVQSRPDVIPSDFELDQNYPNPFNPTTDIKYQISAVSNVTLKVYDILGREVATLANGKENAGSYSVTFDGSRLASGVYFYRLTAGNYIATKKLVLMK